MDEPWFYALWAVGAYLLGSISAGDVVSRAAGVNIRALGTGNPGTANIFREIGPRYAAAVFTLDVAKGAATTVPLYILGLPVWTGLLATASLLAGHFFPIPWRSIGGTGMAAGMGTTLGLLPLGALIATLPAILVVVFRGNAGHAGISFFAVTLVAGGLLHRDAVGAAAVLLAGTAVLIKSWFQYRRR